MKRVDLPSGYEVVNSDELARLRRKERGHDAYLWAIKRMADKARKVGTLEQTHTYVKGYQDSLYDFCVLVKEAPIVE